MDNWSGNIFYTRFVIDVTGWLIIMSIQRVYVCVECVCSRVCATCTKHLFLDCSLVLVVVRVPSVSIHKGHIICEVAESPKF